MSFPLIPPKIQFLDNSGNPLNAGTVEFRSPSTNLYIPSYPTADNADSQTNANANPVILNSRGEAPAGIFLRDGVAYKVILKDSSGDTIWTIDDVKTPYDTTNLDLAGYIANYTYSGGVARTLQDKLDDFVSVKDFGAVGDGSTDDTSALQLAVNQGGTVCIPDGTYNFTNLDFTVAGTILCGSRNAILKCTETGVNFTLHVKADRCEFRGFTLRGSVPAGTYQNGNRGIYCNEDLTSPLTYVFNLVVQDMKIENFGDWGVRFDYVQESQVRNNVIRECGNGGVFFGAGCFDNIIDGNFVEDIIPGATTSGVAPYHPAYGITITRDPSRDFVDAPISRRNTISNNTINNIPSWIGIDSHGSWETNIIGNMISGCVIGIHMEDNDGPTDLLSSSYINIVGNFIKGTGGTSAKAGPGINLKGASDPGLKPQASINVTGNTIISAGWETGGLYSIRHGAIHVEDIEGCVVSGNVIDIAYGVGIDINTAEGIAITGNSIKQVQTESGETYGIYISDGDFDGLIEGNTFFGATPQINIAASGIPDSGYQYMIGDNAHFGSATPHGAFIEELTIASGVITVTAKHHPVDTEGNAASDDLDTINGGSEGRVVTLYAEDNTHTVVVKDSTGNIELEGDFSLDHNHDSITLIYLGTAWRQIGSSNNT